MVLASVRRFTLSLALALGACAAPVPASRPAAPTGELPRDPLSGPWVVRPTARPTAHQIQLDAVLWSRVDTVERSDTLAAMVAATLSRTVGSSPVRFSGFITDYRVARGGRAVAEPVVGLELPFPIAAELGVAGAQPRWTLSTDDRCGATAAAAQTLREIVFTLPESLWAGVNWRDSSEYLICRDSIPLTVRSSRDFRVLGASLSGGAVVVRVERNSTTTMSGHGTQFGEALTIEAHGTGTMQLEIALDGGVTLSGSGDSELTLSMRGRRRTQELLQRTHLVVTSP